ncbi:hypothetical protein [Sphingomonas sp. M1-B02]|uniref:hypothetical protein n=1 Tax=Sphingomonas sp. M1-B02 TaxID=3114300 RepID=UPI00223FF1CE|nr:hypothetical protein [Sphingomonas sp. S6-11]UZK66745.1 hypothetical protein OKW87_02580 [Sphingomonas sp. S6-11]
MVFGSFRGDKRLQAQKAALRETLDALTEVERRISDTALLRQHFAAVWHGVPDDVLIALGKARELGGLLDERAAMAQRELPAFDDAAAFFTRQVQGLERSWQAFLALLLARLTIAQGKSRAVPATHNPSMAACQRALIEIASDLRNAVRTHLDELIPVKADHEGPWPERLDLAKIKRLVDEVGVALDIYSQRSQDEGELPQASSATLMEMIATLQDSIATIEDQRVNLAAHMTITAAMRNCGLST